MSKKPKAVVLLAVLAIFAATAFQNCAPVNFAASGIDFQTVAGTQLKTVLSLASANKTVPVKILFIIDNSNTMTESQAWLERSLPSLLEPLSKLEGEVYVTTTNAHVISWGFPGTSSSAGGESWSRTTQNSVWQEAVEEGDVRAGKANYWKFKLDGKAETVSKIGSLIKNMRTKSNLMSDSQEDGLGNLIWAMEKAPFFQPGDYVLSIILTDEDTTSSYQWDLSKQVNSSDMGAPGPVLRASYLGHVTCSYEVPNSNDGVYDGTTSTQGNNYYTVKDCANTYYDAANCTCADTNYTYDYPTYPNATSSQVFTRFLPDDITGRAEDAQLISKVIPRWEAKFTREKLQFIQIIHDGSCTLGQGQSVGAGYGRFQSYAPSITTNIPICSSQLSPAFAKASANVISVITNSVMLPSNVKKIERVMIEREGKQITVNANEFSVSGQSLGLTIKDLRATDKIVIYSDKAATL